MSNERNISALREILMGLLTRQEYPDDRLEALAITLAANGVLVPDALTDAEIASFFDIPESHAHFRREMLEGWARGQIHVPTGSDKR